MTTNVIWLAPSPTARGAIRSRALRASGSSSPKCGTKRNPSRRSGGQLDEEQPDRTDDHADREPDRVRHEVAVDRRAERR